MDVRPMTPLIPNTATDTYDDEAHASDTSRELQACINRLKQLHADIDQAVAVLKGDQPDGIQLALLESIEQHYLATVDNVDICIRRAESRQHPRWLRNFLSDTGDRAVETLLYRANQPFAPERFLDIAVNISREYDRLRDLSHH